MTAYSYTGAVQTYVVPAGVNYIKADLQGAAGSPPQKLSTDTGTGLGGRGAKVVSIHKVTPGETINVYVGQTMSGTSDAVGYTFGGGGKAKTGANVIGGYAGGGATDIRRGGTALANRISVAGGGGGAGQNDTDTGAVGNGGDAGLATANAAGGAGVSSPAGRSGFGGTQSAGGAGGNATAGGTNEGGTSGLAGSLGLGGQQQSDPIGLASGGGGGGYYGGGSGASVRVGGAGTANGYSGGGGSSYVVSGALVSTSLVASRFGTNTATVDPYVPAVPTIGALSSPATSGRLGFTVDVKELHPSATGTKTVTYELSQAADFSTIAVTKTVNFVSRGNDGAAAGEPTVGASNLATEMGFYVTLPAQGTWYLRVRTSGTESLPTSADSATTTYTSSHVPAATVVSPTGGSFVQYAATTPFRVNATDPWAGDTIRAFQIVVERNDSGTVVYDSGKTVLANNVALGQNTFNQPIPNTARDVTLRWRVRVWDSTDVPSNYSDYSIFTLVDAPVVTITYPTKGGTTDTGAPTFTWTVGLTSGRTIATTAITVRERATNNVVWQRIVTGQVLSATPETTVLVNQVNYSVTVDVIDSANLSGTDSNLFTTSYVSPDPIRYTVDASGVNTQGYVEINWANQAADPRLIAWRVYRRDLPSNVWQLVAEIPNEATKYYRDYLVEAGSSYMWTVTQLADRSGAILESPVGTRATTSTTAAESQVELMAIDNYWIISEDYPELTMLIPNVTSAPETEEYDSATYTIIGRGRHVDYGDRLGYSGTLVSQIRQPERTSLVRARAEALRAAQETYWLRTPFGKLFKVALGNLGWEPAKGTGAMEMGDLTIPYVEVG